MGLDPLVNSAPKTTFVTGGAGFIGSELVHQLLRDTSDRVVTVDALTYAGNLKSLEGLPNASRHHFEQVDLRDRGALTALFSKYTPDRVMHLAAESHVDRSIDGPSPFIATNITGTFNLLEAAKTYLSRLEAPLKAQFRFLHVSTDEVFGSLGETGAFTETTPYDPRSPYSASKAASDHLAKAWFHTYGLPVIVSNCSNNYGPRQFPEKLIPHIILRALAGEFLPVYGKGANIRDWLHVSDHARALILIADKGVPGETYNIGGASERKNIDVVNSICSILDELLPRGEGVAPYRSLIEFVTDRPGHDFRYAMDTSKITRDLGWRPQETFESGLKKTIEWYLNNRGWWEAILNGSYRAERLGRGTPS